MAVKSVQHSQNTSSSNFGAIWYGVFLRATKIILDSEMFALLFSSLPIITHLPFSPPPSSCPACCSAVSPPGKERSHQPMTPCWEMWHFCRYTSHLPKLACITLSVKLCGRMTVYTRRESDRQRCRERDRVAPCLGRQVLPGWIGRALEEGTAGGRAVAEG